MKTVKQKIWAYANGLPESLKKEHKKAEKHSRLLPRFFLRQKPIHLANTNATRFLLTNSNSNFEANNPQAMNFSLSKSLEILERTPEVLNAMLGNLSTDWTLNNEGGETWSVFDIVGHLIHGEKTDWIPRMNIFLSNAPAKTFEPFDRFAQFEESKGKTLLQLLDDFKHLRQKSIEHLRAKAITDIDLKKTAIHPALGEVSLSQLLSTWTVHDLNHIAQISRVMAKQYKPEVGPWVEYLRILQS